MNTQPSTEELLAQDRFELVTGEKAIIEGLTTYLKSSLNVMSCHAVLTNHRIVVCKKSLTAGIALFGIVGAVVSLARKQTKITLQIPIVEIIGIKNLKHGFTRKYRVAIRSGETYDLQFTHPDRWEDELKLLGIVFEEDN